MWMFSEEESIIELLVISSEVVCNVLSILNKLCSLVFEILHCEHGCGDIS